MRVCCFLQMAIKVADLAHLATSSAVHEQWVGALEAEFYSQGDEEKARQMPVSGMMDRQKPGVTQTQVNNLIEVPPVRCDLPVKI